MIEKITPLNTILTVWVGWIMYTSTFDYRRYRFSTMPFTYPRYNSDALKREVEVLGKVYKFKEHITMKDGK